MIYVSACPANINWIGGSAAEQGSDGSMTAASLEGAELL